MHAIAATVNDCGRASHQPASRVHLERYMVVSDRLELLLRHYPIKMPGNEQELYALCVAIPKRLDITIYHAATRIFPPPLQ